MYSVTDHAFFSKAFDFEITQHFTQLERLLGSVSCIQLYNAGFE